MVRPHGCPTSIAPSTLDAYLVTHACVGICTGVASGLPPGRTADDVVEWLLRIAKGVLGAEA